MKPIEALLGVVVLALGIFFLGSNVGWWDAAAWNDIWRFWPVILILFGLAIILRNVWAVLLLVVAFIALGVAGVKSGAIPMKVEKTSYHSEWSFSADNQTASFSQTLDTHGVDTAKFDLGGNYDITISGSDDATNASVNLSGPKEVVEKIRFRKDGNKLVLEDHGDKGLAFFVASLKPVTGTITIPKGLNLDMDLSGLNKTQVNNHYGKLRVDVSGSGNLRFANSTTIDPIVNLSGSGKVELDQCQGGAKIRISGAGKFEADNCVITDLVIRSSGSGTVDIKSGTIGNLDSETSGASNVALPKPTGTIKQENSGASNIRYY